MKTAIKLALLYYLMQILAALTVAPFQLIYTYATLGTTENAGTSEAAVVITMLLGFAYMTLYLWRAKYLADDGTCYSVPVTSTLCWSLLAGLTGIFLLDGLMSQLTFLPDLMKDTFSTLQDSWPGIACVAVLGPVLEELLFRGAITKVLLRKYTPTRAIVISGLIFGIFHLNPAQVVVGCLMGFLLAWLYYRTGSLLPGILIHILNNSLSVWSSATFSETDTTAGLIGQPLYLILLAASLALFLLALKKIKTENP